MLKIGGLKISYSMCDYRKNQQALKLEDNQ